jgi:anti-anti-sigma factor
VAIEKWSEQIYVVELGDDPQFTDDLANLMDMLESEPADVVLNFSAVSFINSSDVARLLRLRKMLVTAERRLVFCGVNTQVWGIFITTGLEKIFNFTNDISTALASLQLSQK